MDIRSEWMEVQMTELKSALQNLWSDGLYKIILSNAIKKNRRELPTGKLC